MRGSFKIPDDQNNALGINKSAKNARIVGVLKYGEVANTIKRNPNMLIKEMINK